MSSLFVFVLLAGLVSSIQGDCFLEGQPAKKIEEDTEVLTEAAFNKCNESNPSATEEDIEKCVDEAMMKAAKDCGKIVKNETDQSNWYICFCEKLDAPKPTQEELSFDYFKNEVLNYTNENSTKAVSDKLDKCKSVPDFWDCGYKKLVEGPCPEAKPIYDEMVEWKKQIKEAK